jgi:hypothetical protein
MNTGKQVNAMVVVLFVLVATLGAYTLFDPFRSDNAEDRQLEKSVSLAAESFALNCRLCHGDAGQGGEDGGRLTAAAVLDDERLQGIEDGVFTQAAYEEAFNLVENTITCGRVGTQMPAWSEDQGGTLNNEQIRQLTLLITHGAFDVAQEHADEIDAETAGHATLQMPDGTLSEDATELTVSNAQAYSRGQYIRIRIDEESEERMRILPGRLRVTRGAGAAQHPLGEPVTLASGAPFVDDAGEEIDVALIEAMDAEAVGAVVPDPTLFNEGDAILIGSEPVTVEAIESGLPSTRQRLAEEIGRETESFLISGSAGIQAGTAYRVDGELMEILEVRDDGATAIVVDADVAVDDETVSLSDPLFFGRDYTFRVGDEWMRVIEPVDTGQFLSESIGRAESTISLTGTEGIEPGMVIRMGGELIRIDEVIEPAAIEVARAQNETAAAAHDDGDQILAQVPTADGAAAEEPEYEDTEQSVLAPFGPEDTLVQVSATSGIAIDSTIQIGDELMLVTNTLPAVFRVTREVGGTAVEAHPRRSPVYDGNYFIVERGFDGTSAAAHSPGEAVFLTEVSVERQIDDSELQDHSKNAEIFTGNQLIVERGVRNTEPAEHENGLLVMDFPLGPDDPPVNEAACGQVSGGGAAPVGTPQPTPEPGSVIVGVELLEYSVAPIPPSLASGPTAFNVVNGGAASHNFRAIATDLAPDALPVDGAAVDEAQLNVIAMTATDLAAGGSQLVSAGTLEPGPYVLICNIPTHYELGMFAPFEVTAP